MFRRNFDQEAVDIANGRRPTRATERVGRTHATASPPAQRFIIVAKCDRVLPDLLKFRCDIKPVGGDWHIRVPAQSDLNRVVSLLQSNKIHGVLKRVVPKGQQ